MPNHNPQALRLQREVASGQSSRFRIHRTMNLAFEPSTALVIAAALRPGSSYPLFDQNFSLQGQSTRPGLPQTNTLDLPPFERTFVRGIRLWSCETSKNPTRCQMARPVLHLRGGHIRPRSTKSRSQACQVMRRDMSASCRQWSFFSSSSHPPKLHEDLPSHLAVTSILKTGVFSFRTSRLQQPPGTSTSSSSRVQRRASFQAASSLNSCSPCPSQ